MEVGRKECERKGPAPGSVIKELYVMNTKIVIIITKYYESVSGSLFHHECSHPTCVVTRGVDSGA